MASKILREHNWGAGTAAPLASPSPAGGEQAQRATAAIVDRKRAATEKTRAVGRASKRFGQAIWAPVVHLSGVLWLEVTGLFFAIFALYFAQSVYRLRHGYLRGQEHTRFLLYVGITAAFFYFAVTSFLRARRRARGAKRQGRG